MKIGIIIPLYNAADNIARCLAPWISFKSIHKDVSFHITCIDGKFNEFSDSNPSNNSNDGTLDILNAFARSGQIDKIIHAPRGLNEAQVRNLGLAECKYADCDILWNVDSDEFYTEEEIRNIIDFISPRRFIAYFSIHFKNYVFDEKTWVDEFCPPRIWKIKYGNVLLDGFYWDNDCMYLDGETSIQDKQLAHVKIPKTIAFVKHHTWLSNSRSKAKVEYQEKHFAPPRGNGCSYRWNNQKNRLEFNLPFFVANNLPLPTLHTDE